MNDKFTKNYQLWNNHINDLDSELKEWLNDLSEPELKSAFGVDLDFGTAGLRGILGPGTGRMNIYTIRRASMAYAYYLKQHYSTEDLTQRGVIIGHDNRKWSALFTIEAAKVLAHFGICVRLFPGNEITPTPVVSFATKAGNFIGGIVVTASHNPKEYNGYKIYDPDGSQLLPEFTTQIKAFYDGITAEVFTTDFTDNQDWITDVNQSLKEEYKNSVKTMPFYPTAPRKVRVVFSNLNGAARNWTPVILKELGYEVIIVKEQYEYDPDFKTCPYPNPEILSNYDLGIKYAKEHDADVIILNDPDADRIGIGVKTKIGEYRLLTGNETAPILLQYWLEQKVKFHQLPKNPVVISTFVSGDLTDYVANNFNVKVTKTLTGFKWIGAATKVAEANGENFVFGFEEAYGYILNPITRDKDGIQTSIVVAEACDYYAKKGQTLVDVLTDLYKKYGNSYCFTYTHTYKGQDGPQKIQSILDRLRSEGIDSAAGIACVKVEDYLDGLYNMPAQDLLKFYFADRSWFAVRASGTEPKIKFYYNCVSDVSEQAAKIKQHEMQTDVNNKFIT